MSFTSKDDFAIIEEQYQELLQAQAADQGSTTTVFPVYTQFNACVKRVSQILNGLDITLSTKGSSKKTIAQSLPLKT
ncbi:hypothetical protein DSO57_1028506, partial [Entomophthora muscae]